MRKEAGGTSLPDLTLPGKKAHIFGVACFAPIQVASIQQKGMPARHFMLRGYLSKTASMSPPPPNLRS